MGASNSRQISPDELETLCLTEAIEEEAIHGLVHFPFYYMQDATVDNEDIECARKSWSYIINNSSPRFHALCDEEKSMYPTCAYWFAAKFYDRFFELLPYVRQQQFRSSNMRIQGVAMIGMISGVMQMLGMLKQKSGRENWQKKMQNLAKDHAAKGVVHGQYGILGEVLIWTLTFCLGNERVNTNTWLKIYSLMLKYIIPKALAEERTIIAHKSYVNYAAESLHFQRHNQQHHKHSTVDDENNDNSHRTTEQHRGRALDELEATAKLQLRRQSNWDGTPRPVIITSSPAAHDQPQWARDPTVQHQSHHHHQSHHQSHHHQQQQNVSVQVQHAKSTASQFSSSSQARGNRARVVSDDTDFSSTTRRDSN